ncbi:hypothetical protein SLS62_010429 [Diatrype stigma]|uniref:Uncharacterized protein n=1 Tax=Diatrype stigma TaxID=117547 RepID=A0AAN9UC88_9PEZI
MNFTAEEASLLCPALERALFDYVELSGGTYETFSFGYAKKSQRARGQFLIKFAEQIYKTPTTTRLYTTGGFKTAMKYVNGVGIGWAAVQEPDLPKNILSSRVKGSMEYKLDDNNFVTSARFAMIQVHPSQRRGTVKT